MIISTFFQTSAYIQTETKNIICPMPSALEVFPISICTVLHIFRSLKPVSKQYNQNFRRVNMIRKLLMGP